ncbi:hypothetical protein HOB10_02075 [Candidatus Parcubacteria bacterium]|jgi:hypothetical protein|nr:hypothetical protein [Candidatus Parcubacteria bacterium]
MNNWVKLALSFVAILLCVVGALLTYGHTPWVCVCFCVCGIIFVFVAKEYLCRVEATPIEEVPVEVIMVDSQDRREPSREKLRA